MPLANPDPVAPPSRRAPGGDGAAARAVIRCLGLRKSFGGVEVLKGVDFEALDRRVVCIVGPSGSGKSTLLRCLNHLEMIDDGEICLEGELVGYRRWKNALAEAAEREIARMRARIGMVFQSFNLFPHLTVLREPGGGTDRRCAGSRAPRPSGWRRNCLRASACATRLDAYPRQLSGGQQQRVAIARALALRPKVLLFDEPTSALDPELVGEVLSVIKELARSGTTMIIVTHEIGFAREVADNVVFMSDGMIVEQGSAEAMFQAPRQAALRSFIRRLDTR